MKKIKTALAVSLLSTTLLAPSLFAKDNLEEKINKYEIYCSIFHVGDGHYKTSENDKGYKIGLHAKPIGIFKSLGLKYDFTTQGYKEKEKLYPIRFVRQNRSRITVENPYEDRNRRIATKTEATTMYFDYKKLEAKAYAYTEIEGEREVKYDTNVKITKEIKDFLTFVEEFRRGELKDHYELKTIAKGKIYPFPTKKIGEETINLNGEYYETIVYETRVNKELFGVDSKAKLWIHKKKDHTVLKCWIENGPLWTSINVTYSGSKSELE